MKIGIVGLGLIGGSFAKAYKRGGNTVLAFNRDRSVTSFAEIDGAVDGELTKDNIGECDLVLICIYPEAAAEYLNEMAPFIGDKPVVIDCCGTKRYIFERANRLARENGFTYVGGHPMAGKQYSGFKYADETLFEGAPMVLVPEDRNDIQLLSRIKSLLEPVGFGSIEVTTAENHDRTIAFTSQLAHVVSNAYIKSPTAAGHKGFSAGSYKDMTRVAWLNPEMWTELFMENKDFLISELDTLIENLEKYTDALKSDDREELIRLLEDGKKRKEEVDG